MSNPPGSGQYGRPVVDYGLAYLQQPPQGHYEEEDDHVPGLVPPVNQQPKPRVPTTTTVQDVLSMKRADRRERPDADKVIAVEEYLSGVPGHRMVDADELYEMTGVDLRPGSGRVEEGVIKLLEGHPKIEVLPTPGQYKYVSKYVIRDHVQLLQWLEKYKNGLRESDIKDCYPGIDEDLSKFIRGGEVLAVKEDKDMVVFARGAPFLVALSGEVEVLDDGATLRMTRDLRREIRRGEGVRVGEEWARVSTMEDRKVQRARADPPPSVSTGAGREGWPPEDLRTELDETSKSMFRVVYREAFNPEAGLPLTEPLERMPHGPVPAVRHGCTTDIKDLLWAKTREKVPKDEAELKRRLEEAALGAHASSSTKRPRMTVALSKQMQRKRKKEEAEERWRQELKARAALVQEQQARSAARKAAASGGGKA